MIGATLDMSDVTFQLDSGRTCLDFANTLDSAGEHLNSYADLVAFAAQSNLLNPEDAAWLQAEAQRDQVAAEGVLGRARRLRAAIYGIFSALANGKPPRQQDVDSLNVDLAATQAHARVVPAGQGGSYRWGWSGRNMDAPLWGVIRSAADLLTSDDERRLLRECNGVACNWLFVDTTKNRSRQWCSMRSCGNREKARRHYRRRRSQQTRRSSGTTTTTTSTTTS